PATMAWPARQTECGAALVGRDFHWHREDQVPVRLVPVELEIGELLCGSRPPGAWAIRRGYAHRGPATPRPFGGRQLVAQSDGRVAPFLVPVSPAKAGVQMCESR